MLSLTIFEFDHFWVWPFLSLVIFEFDHFWVWPFLSLIIFEFDHFWVWPFFSLTIFGLKGIFFGLFFSFSLKIKMLLSFFICKTRIFVSFENKRNLPSPSEEYIPPLLQIWNYPAAAAGRTNWIFYILYFPAYTGFNRLIHTPSGQ